ncbi:MAG: ATP-binding protein [Gemmatimonadota bacterium]
MRRSGSAGVRGLQARLYLAGAAIILILLIPTVYGWIRLSELRSIAFDLRARHASAFLAVGELQSSISRLEQLQRHYVAEPVDGARSAMFEELDEVSFHLAHLARTGYAEEAAGQAAMVDTLRLVTSRIDSLVRFGSREQAERELQALSALAATARSSLEEVARAIDRQSAAQATRAQAIADTSGETILVAFGVALAVAVLVGGLSVATRILPLFRLRAAMAAVASGRFEPPEGLPYGRRDEIGDLCRSFRSMTEQLAELDRLKAEFVGIASHELKSPVSVIQGYVEMLEDRVYGPLTDEQVERLAYVREQTRVLAQRVNHLLSLSRMQARGLELSLRDVGVAEFLEELHVAFSPRARQEGIEFAVQLHASAPEVVRIDPERVGQELLGNLISNAFKFTSEGGRIDLRAFARGERIVFEVRDTGAGISNSDLPYIFEKYYRAGRQTQKVGSGLGLAIAREVTEAHGGKIEVWSRSGEGSTFQISLPVHASAPSAGARAGPAEEKKVEADGTASARPAQLPSTVRLGL